MSARRTIKVLLPTLFLASCVSTAPASRHALIAAAQPSHSVWQGASDTEQEDVPVRSRRRGRFEPKTGPYVVLGFMKGAVSDEDFDGVGGVSGGGSAEIMPMLDDGTGKSFGFGMRSPGLSMEFNISSLDHDSVHLARSGVFNSETENWNFDFRFSSKNAQRFQPYFLAGFGFSWLTVENGSAGGSQVKDAVYNGLGLSLGIGANFYATESLAIGLEFGQRFVSYNSVDGVADGDLASSASGSGSFMGLRASFTF